MVTKVSTGVIADGAISEEKLAAGVAIPADAVMPFTGAAAPTGWLLCDGSAVSRTTYADLFDVVADTYGAGDGSTTFNLPDLRGRVPAGKDDMGGAAASRLTTAGSGVDGATLGASGGAETHTLTEAQMPSHTHSGSFLQTGASNWRGTDAATVQVNPSTAGEIGSTGGGEAHNNTQPTLVLNYIIKT